VWAADFSLGKKGSSARSQIVLAMTDGATPFPIPGKKSIGAPSSQRRGVLNCGELCAHGNESQAVSPKRGGQPLMATIACLISQRRGRGEWSWAGQNEAEENGGWN